MKYLVLITTMLLISSPLYAKPVPITNQSSIEKTINFGDIHALDLEKDLNARPQYTRKLKKSFFLYPKRYPECLELVSGVVVDGKAIHEEDIILGDVSNLKDVTDDPVAQSRAGHVKVAGNVLKLLGGSEYAWPKGIIPYTIDERLKSKKRFILEAIRDWNAKTNVNIIDFELNKKLIERQLGSLDEVWKIRFIPSDKRSSSSYVGLRKVAVSNEYPRSQPIKLGSFNPRTIKHEIGHAIGLFHEHARHDRSRHITLHKHAIDEDSWHNFKKRDEAKDVGDYDFASIMHYAESIFTNGNGPTFDVKDYLSDHERANVGRSAEISDGDVKSVNAIYPLDKLSYRRIIEDTDY